MSTDFEKRYFITADLAKDLTKLADSMYAESNPAAEINNPKPLFETLGFRKPKTMAEKLQRLFEGPNGLIQQMYEQGEETPDEMFDFSGLEDDYEPISPYEVHDMVEEAPMARPYVPEVDDPPEPKKPENGLDNEPEKGDAEK